MAMLDMSLECVQTRHDSLLMVLLSTGVIGSYRAILIDRGPCMEEGKRLGNWGRAQHHHQQQSD